MTKIVPVIDPRPPSRNAERGYDSDESSKLFDDGMDGDSDGNDDAFGTSAKSFKKGKSAKSKKSAASKVLRQRNEIRAKVVKDVMDKIMPDIGAYDVDGTTQARKESEAGAFFVRWMKFIGLLELDLHDAVLTGSIRRVRGSIRKLKSGKNPQPELINQYDENGYTPLSLGVKVNDTEIVEALLDAGAIPDLVDEVSGRTPLFFSIQLGNHAMTALLISHGASVNMPDFKCITPLMVAASLNDAHHCEILTQHFAEPDIQDENGWTALHYATMANAISCVGFLVEIGADKNIKDINKRKPIHFAKFKEYGEIISILAGKGGTLA